MGKQDEDWKNLREAWNKFDKTLKNQSNCPTFLQKWIFKSATTSTKTTATSEPARSSKAVATTQPPTSSNNVEQAKEVEVEELPSKYTRPESLEVRNRRSDFENQEATRLRAAEIEGKKKLEAPQTLPKPKRGRPPTEKEQEGLQEAILNLVYYEASTDDPRRSEILKCAKTVDELLAGYNIFRTALYYRLIPRNVSTKDGGRHVNTVPVKLIRPSNSLRKEHEDTHFCAGQIKHIRDLAELLGPQAVNVLSVDDKARVPLGLPAAQKQAPILMHYERQILMPDYDYPIAKGLKLIPSVIGVLCFKDWKVSYSGPTCISIRGGAIDSSTAETHRQDLIKYLHHDKMRDYFWSNNRIKPVLVVFSDGGPDEAPRNEKVLQAAVKSFKMLDLDAMFVCTNAPHQSARNPVERRMAPLSQDLCGLIIPHDICGTHLHARGRTIDKVLEKKNFEAAGRILAEVWNRTVIDGFEVIAQYVPPASTAASESTEANDVLWRNRHILQSKYCLPVVKCQDESCCSPMISRLRLYLEDGFLPAPVMFRHGLYGLEACSQENIDGRFLDISQRLQNASLVPVKPCPNDYYCPSVIPELQKLICPVCKKYFFRKARLTKHGKIHKNLATIFELAEEIETEVVSSIDEGGVQIIEDMEAWMQPIYEDDTGN
ncbi:hypothetical protein ILUMI_00363 [Ignelater luminosus]|uniref:C2H2-type domain-containing protein n=1 Tax=Ignelater luminosus TaxID=2038154 RepID=A0A8K0DM18_IGNLU|nr:hypothetical protein ILUMI_00363 [Ignelater luminosus]